MPKIDIETIREVLLEEKIENAKVNDIVRKLNKELEEEKAEKQPDPKPKKKFVLIKESSDSFSSCYYLCQVEENKTEADIIGEIKSLSEQHNSLVKKPKKKVNSIGSFFSKTSPKLFKSSFFKRKSKVPIDTVISSNRIFIL